MLDTPKISLTIQWDVVKLWWLSDKTNFGSAQHGIDWIGKQGGSGIHPGWNPMQVTPKIGLIMQWVALKCRSLCDKKFFTVKSSIQHRILSWFYPTIYRIRAIKRPVFYITLRVFQWPRYIRIFPIFAWKSPKKWTFRAKKWRFIKFLLKWWSNQERPFICADMV